MKKYYYRNYVPTFVDGVPIITKYFDTEQEVIEAINKKLSDEFYKNYIITIDENTIVIVNKNKREWWVKFFTNISKDSFPSYKKTIKELGYDDEDDFDDEEFDNLPPKKL